MSNTPTPPAGYKLVKGEDIKDCVPEGAKLWLYGSMSWRPSVDIGEKANPALYDDFYAIPETKPEHPNKAAKVAKLEDIPDDAYIFSQWINHLNDWMPFRPTKKSEVTDPYSACWFAYTDASGAHPDYYTAPYDIKTSVVEKPEPAIPEVGPQPPEGYVLRHRSEMPEELPDYYMFWVAAYKDWYVSTAKKLSAITPEDVWFAVKADDAKVHQDLHVEAIESYNPLSQQEGGDHYKSLAIQPVEFIHANKLSFLEGCVVKRVCRHRAKNKAEDIRKAIHELRLILKLEYGEDLP